MPAPDDDELVDLRMSRDLLRRAHELAGTGSYVVDLTRRTIRMSAELVHLFHAGDEAIELPLDEYRRRFYFPDDLEVVRAQAEAAYAHGKSLQLESRIVRGDGVIIWAQTTASFERGADGKPLVVGVAKDITQSKRDLATLAEQARKLERTAERLKLATDAAAIGTWDWDVATGQMRWDATMFRLYGIHREEFGGTLEAWMSRVCLADRDRVVQAAVASPTEWTDEFSICWPDGRLRVLRVAARIVRDAAGVVVRMVGVNYDITAQRRAEESLVASEALLLQLVKHTPAAVAMLDREMRYLQASDRWISAYRLEGQPIFGRSHYEVFPDIPQHWKDVHQRVLAGAVERCDVDPFPRADGTTEWLEWEVRPWHTAAGDIGGVIMFTQVITERIRAEERLRESEERWRTLIEQAPIGIGVQRDGIVLYANPKLLRTWGYAADELVGTSITKMWTPADATVLKERTRARLAGAAIPPSFEGLARHRDGRTFPARAETVTIDLPDGPARISFLSDVTEQKRAEDEQRSLEAQLRQAQKMEAIGVLAGGVAHDFNNLLAVILSYSSMLLDDLTDGHPMRADLQEIKLASERAGQMTRQLLAFSRQQVLQPRVVDLNDVVAGTEKMLRRLIGEDIELVTRLATSHARAFIDPGQLEQVLMNLVVNARDAMPDGGRLGIDLTRREVEEAVAIQFGLKPGWFVVLSVTDTGAGMDAATQARIFEPFFTTKEVGKGTGLGLSTVFGIVEQSGGHVEVSSALGDGTTFRIWLPLATGTVARTASETLAPAARGGATILVVEDEDAVRKLACTILLRRGYRVIEARSGADALAVCDQHTEPIDLVLTDVVMPGMSGDELVTRLRTLRPGIRVAFMSGYPDRTGTGGRVAVREIYIPKPFTPASLLKPILEALARP